jgi:NADH:ubiquinone oxidoreductase subunit E
VLPVLRLVQEQEGFVSREAAAFVAELVGVSPREVEGVASFHSIFGARPGPLHTIRICRGVCCMMKGAREIEERISRRLAIGVGRVSDDGRFMLEPVDCLGLCDRAPALMVGDRVYGGMIVEGVDEMLKELGAKI